MIKANEEVWSLHQENPDGSLDPGTAISLNQPNSDLIIMTLLSQNIVICSSLWDWIKESKQKSQNMVQAVQQKASEDPSECLETPYQAYRKYTNLDPQTPEDIKQ